MYKVTLPLDYNGMRYGIEFFRGVGKTDDKRIAELLKGKGISVEPVSDFGNSFMQEPDPEEERPTPRRGRSKTED